MVDLLCGRVKKMDYQILHHNHISTLIFFYREEIMLYQLAFRCFSAKMKYLFFCRINSYAMNINRCH
jgi:predicted HAD superfamily hydrolase